MVSRKEGPGKTQGPVVGDVVVRWDVVGDEWFVVSNKLWGRRPLLEPVKQVIE